MHTRITIYPLSPPLQATKMSIQMSLVFIITIIEMVMISLILLPLPPKFQNLLIDKYSLLIKNSNFQIIIIFIDTLVSIMFVDACKNGLSWGKQDELIEFNKNTWDEKAKKFYCQRNLYILGALLAFQICIWFLIMQLNSTIKNKDKLSKLIKEPNSKSEIEIELKKLEIDVKNLKNQYDSNWNEISKKDKVDISINEKKNL